MTSLSAGPSGHLDSLPVDVLGAIRADVVSSLLQLLKESRPSSRDALFKAISLTSPSVLAAIPDLLGVTKFFKDLLSEPNLSSASTLAALEALDHLPMNRSLLDDSRIGITVNKLTKNGDHRVASLATSIVVKWKQMLQDLKKRPASDPLRSSDEIPLDPHSKKRPLEEDAQSASGAPLKKQRIDPLAGTNSGANSPVGTLSPTLSSTPGGPPFATGAAPIFINLTIPATSVTPVLPPAVSASPNPTEDVEMTDAPVISSSHKKSILAPADHPKTKKKVSFAEQSKLVQEKGTPRWVTVALNNLSQKANLSEQDMAKIAFEEAESEFRSARQEMIELTRPPWSFPKPLAPLSSSKSRAKPTDSAMAAFQERHNNTEFVATYLSSKTIPPDPTNKITDTIENDDSKAAVIPLEEVKQEPPKPEPAPPAVAQSSMFSNLDSARLAQLISMTNQTPNPNAPLMSIVNPGGGLNPISFGVPQTLPQPQPAPIPNPLDLLQANTPITSAALGDLLKALAPQSSYLSSTFSPVSNPLSQFNPTPSLSSLLSPPPLLPTPSFHNSQSQPSMQSDQFEYRGSSRDFGRNDGFRGNYSSRARGGEWRGSGLRGRDFDRGAPREFDRDFNSSREFNHSNRDGSYNRDFDRDGRDSYRGRGQYRGRGDQFRGY